MRWKGTDARFQTRAGSDDIYSIFPGREKDVEIAILDSLSEGDVFVDVGANVGYYSVVAGVLVGTTGRVIAIEPIEDTCQALRRNLELNQLNNVTVEPKACWNKLGELSISLPRGIFGWASAVNDPQGDEQVTLCVTLDEICRDFVRIRLIKIDAEGAEIEILSGGTRAIRKTDVIAVEVTSNEERVAGMLTNASFLLRKAELPFYLLAYRDRSVRESGKEIG